MDNKKKSLTLMIIAIAIFLGIISFATYAFFAGANTNVNVNANVITGGMYAFTATPDGEIDIEVKASDMMESGVNNTVPIKSDNANITVSLLSSSDEELTICTYDIIWEYQNDEYKEADKTLENNEYEFSVKIDKDNETVLNEKDLSKFSWTTVSNKKRSVIYHGSTTSSSSTNATTEKYTISANVYNINVNQVNLQNKNFTSKIILTNVTCTVGMQSPGIAHNGVIPAGGTYYRGVTSTSVGDYTGGTAYTAGNNFPSAPQNGDVYVYGDYEYRYNYEYRDVWGGNTPQNGWGVRVLDDDKTSYGEILTTINGKDIKSVRGTFYGCQYLENAPVIPNGVTEMLGAFMNCTSLVNAPVIPNGVTFLDSEFSGCTSLVTAPTIPDSVTVMFSTFKGCTSLVTAPTIPNTVTTMYSTFESCTSLVTAPTIPSSVTNMPNTFKGCTSLSGVVEINGNPTIYPEAFEGTQITGITGSCSQATKDALIATK